MSTPPDAPPAAPTEEPPVTSAWPSTKVQIVWSAVFVAVTVVLLGGWAVLRDAQSNPDEVAGGTRTEFSPGLTYVPADGWVLDPDLAALFYELAKGGATVVLLPANPDSTAEAAMQTQRDGFEVDTSNDWQVGEPDTFTTDAGASGRSIYGKQTDEVIEVFAIDSDAGVVLVTFTGSDSSWTAYRDEVESMVKSIEVDPSKVLTMTDETDEPDTTEGS